MHDAQITKFRNGGDVFMVLNRGGKEDDGNLSNEEWAKREEQFYLNMKTKYPMYQGSYNYSITVWGLGVAKTDHPGKVSRPKNRKIDIEVITHNSRCHGQFLFYF